MKAILDYLYRTDKPKKAKENPAKQEAQHFMTEKENKNKMLEEEIVSAIPQKGERKLRIKRPIIFICNNPYAKGMKLLRETSFVFNFQRHIESVVERLKDVCSEERIVADVGTLTQMVSMFDGDMRSCLNFLDMFCTKANVGPLGTYNLDLYNLKPIGLSHQNYFD
jgi:hypothetical protein